MTLIERLHRVNLEVQRAALLEDLAASRRRWRCLPILDTRSADEIRAYDGTANLMVIDSSIIKAVAFDKPGVSSFEALIADDPVRQGFRPYKGKDSDITMQRCGA
ncbi:hypothetical protein [Rhizobium sp. P28RR-XV]|uniref:hypothetical protein n=1 Tax=Rhizobium sp. P28RR-XV TaxID=2726737 RepID=UPI003917D4E6